MQDNEQTIEQTIIEPVVYTVPGVQKTVTEIQHQVLSISYDVLARMNRNEEVPPEVLEKQTMLKGQLTLWTKILSDLQKSEKGNERGGMGALMADMQSVKLGVAAIQQKIVKEDG